jgi:membrane-associated phospholipid phosphatase
MTVGAQFRPPPPPALSSDDYATAFNEVESLGRVDSTTRSADQTQIAFFWRDATGTSYAFGHWNKIAQGVSAERGLDLVADARLFAVLNIATADAIISCWDTKYTYNFWRPVTAIQFPGDSTLNPATPSDPTWTPLITTPNFPSYTSAHSTVSGAAAAVLTSLFGPGYHFTVGSEGLPGVTRSFAGFDTAAAEAGQSRIYGGIHYQFDNQNGLASGHTLGRFVVGNFLLPADEGDEADSRHDDHTGGRAAFQAEELALLLAGAGNASAANRGARGEEHSAPATGQPSYCSHPDRPRCWPEPRTNRFNTLRRGIGWRRGRWTSGCSIKRWPAWMAACSRAPFRAMRPSPGPGEITQGRGDRISNQNGR